MQAIILAAGMGKRLKNLTGDVTKCMVKVNGVTMIERMLSQLDSLDLSRVVVVAGYKAEKLKEFISTLRVKTPIQYVENQIYDKTNNIYSLYLAREYLRQEDTLLLESDLIFDDCVLKSLKDDPHPSLALVARYESWMDGTVVTLRDNNTVDEFLDKEHFRFSDIKSYYKTVNLYKFSKSFSEEQYVPFLEAYSRALGNNEYYEQVLKVITKLNTTEIKAKVLETGRWYEIDDIQDLDIAESLFEKSDSAVLDRINGRYGGYWRYPKMLDFCYLVNPFFPPQKLLDEIKANFETLVTTYPSGQRVNNLLSAKYFGVDQAKIATGNGAAELIKAVMEICAGKIGVVCPTFEEYPNRKPGSVEAFTPANKSFSYTAEDLTAFFSGKQIDMLVVVNPDNPSGNYITRGGLIVLAKWARTSGIKLVIDESFVDFADYSATLLDDGILAEYPNLIVIKSISKAYGVPGLRLGVLACGDAALMTKLKKTLPIWNINSLAEFYLQICEKYKSNFIGSIKRFEPVRDEFFTALQGISFLEPIPSKANYITCRLTTEHYTARTLAEAPLCRHDILIKDLSGKSGINGEYVRLSVKTPEENARLLNALNALA
jgi:histidinol-phosphate/aromatic aminotransferase/cobyric acid decarboxylase-like protein/choline kinase